ncbi:proteoglycan 4 [Austrofundulus limnaeus]|uniref:Proteoglycan 4 n=1 Tax=Austrofundulus limnaeus TaxID=52670 RepID=A0A2I4CTM9_AUSLI|nr:PREDICTED: proteoglycan 4-like [Austrofundulus limnaeus]
MDPEKRAQCSELLQHPLFTQDTFHIRFLDDLNAKIQKEHRENSTLPQITKIPRSDTNKRDEKNCRGKDKKQPEDTDESVNKDIIDKPKGKQPSKLSKTNRNTTESLLSTQPKTFGNKIIHNTTQCPTKTKPEKLTSAEIKNESEASKTTKTFISKPPDETEAEVTLKKKNLTTTKSKQESVTPPEPKKDLPQNIEDKNCCGPDPEKNTSLCKPEPTQEFLKSWSNPTMKVSNMAPAMFHDSKPYKTSPVAEFQFDQQEDASKSPKVLPKNQKTTTNSSPKPNTNILNSSSKTFPSHLSEQPSTETTSTHNTAAVPKELSSLKISKVEFTSRALSKDRELIDKRDFRSCHGYLNPVTEIPEGVVLLSQTSDGSFKASAGQNTKVAKDDRFTLNLVGTAVVKVTNNSEKENQEDLASQLVPISSTNQPVKPTLKAYGNSGASESDADSFKVPHPKQNPLKTHQHTRSSVIPKTQKPTPAPDPKKKSDRNVLTTSRDSTLSLTLDHKASTEGFKTNISDVSAPRSSTPSPPLSSSNPLLLPPSSQLMTSLSVFNNPAAGDYLVQGAGFTPGTNSLRCVDYSGTRDRPNQQFAASKLTGSFTVLASENSFISEMAKNKSHVHFPDIRSSTLLELREKEGKHNKGAIKNLRKDKNLVSFSPPSEGQGHKSYTSTTKL